MPIYAFACTRCGHTFDHLQKLSDADPAVCPSCGAQNSLRRQLTAPQFRLAGSGWYETDFKSSKEHQHNLAGDAGKPAEAKPAEAPAATNPASAT